MQKCKSLRCRGVEVQRCRGPEVLKKRCRGAEEIMLKRFSVADIEVLKRCRFRYAEVCRRRCRCKCNFFLLHHRPPTPCLSLFTLHSFLLPSHTSACYSGINQQVQNYASPPLVST
jgi:hypothetical protein